MTVSKIGKMVDSLKKNITIVYGILVILKGIFKKRSGKSVSKSVSLVSFLLDTCLDSFLFRQWQQDIAVDAHRCCLRAMRDENEARGSVQGPFFQRERDWSRPVAASEV